MSAITYQKVGSKAGVLESVKYYVFDGEDEDK